MTTQDVQDTIDARLVQEFVDESADVLNEMNVLLGNVRGHALASEPALGQIRRHCHNLRAGARAVNLPAVELAVHRLDDYVADLTELTPRALDDVQAFLDKLAAAIEGRVDPAGLSQFVRQLPAFHSFDVGDIELRDVEVMLVSPQRATAHFVARELQACGYRVVNVRTAFEAMAHVVRTQPDLIICSAVLDELSGVDLACALAAMPATRRVPFALLTSFEWGHASLDQLPMRSAIIRTGARFGDDLAEALSRFAIT